MLGCFLLAKIEQKRKPECTDWHKEFNPEGEIKNEGFDKKEIGKFARNTVIALVVYGSIMLLSHNIHYLWPYLTATVVVLLYLLFPIVLTLSYVTAKKIVNVIVRTVSNLVLISLFYIIFTPVGLIIKICDKDILDRRIEKDSKSYWKQIDKVVCPKELYERQF